MSRASEPRAAIRLGALKSIFRGVIRDHEFQGYWFAKMPEGGAALRIAYCIKPTIELAHQLVALEDDGDVEAMERKVLEAVIDHLCLLSIDRVGLALHLLNTLAYPWPSELLNGSR